MIYFFFLTVYDTSKYDSTIPLVNNLDSKDNSLVCSNSKQLRNLVGIIISDYEDKFKVKPKYKCKIRKLNKKPHLSSTAHNYVNINLSYAVKRRLNSVSRRLINLNTKPSLPIAKFRDSLIYRQYKSEFIKKPLNIIWIKQCYIKAQTSLIMLMSVNKTIFCDAYNEVLNMLPNDNEEPKAKRKKLSASIINQSVDFKQYVLLGKVINACNRYKSTSKINNNVVIDRNSINSTDSLCSDISKMHLDSLPRFFYDKILLPNLFQKTNLYESSYKKIIKKDTTYNAMSFIEFSVLEKQILFILFPSFVLYQESLANVWIRDKKAQMLIMDILLHLDILLKLTKYAFSQSDSKCYRKFILFCIDIKVYGPIMNVVELLFATLVSLHDYKAEPLNIFEAWKIKVFRITNNKGDEFYDSKNYPMAYLLKNAETYAFDFKNLLDLTDEKVMANRKVFLYDLKLSNELRSFSYSICVKEKKHIEKETLLCDIDFDNIRKIWCKIEAINNISARFRLLERINKQYKQFIYKNEPSIEFKTYIFLIMNIFQNDKSLKMIKAVFDKQNKTLYLKPCLRQNIGNKVTQDDMKLLIANCINWFKAFYKSIFIKTKPLKLLMGILEYFEQLIIQINNDVRCIHADLYIRDMIKTQYAMYTLITDNYKGESIEYIEEKINK